MMAACFAPKLLIKTTKKNSHLKEDSIILGLKVFLQTIVCDYNFAHNKK